MGVLAECRSGRAVSQRGGNFGFTCKYYGILIHVHSHIQIGIVHCKKPVRLQLKRLLREVLHSSHSTAELSCVKQQASQKKKKNVCLWYEEKKNPTAVCRLHEIARVIRTIVYKYGPSGRNSVTLSRKNR